jgi:dihydrolipoamide dehydrogenase
MDDLNCDVAIIGAGTAGLAAERAARKAGAKTLLIDDRSAGTTCASVGCMPSKLLIAAADAAFDARKASMLGIEATPAVDGRAVMARVRKERDRFVAETLKSIEKLPSGVYVKQRARFSDATTLALVDGRKVSAKAIVVATGSRPSVPKEFEKLGDIVLTNETIFELRSLPRSIAVVGAGPLGLELAQAMARLGVETIMFDQGDRIAALRDAEVAKSLRSVLGKEFPIYLGVKLQVEKDSDEARLSWSGASSGTASFERVLVAAGRPPALHDLNLAATGLETSDKGIPKFDPSTLQCGDAPIFLAGDADAQRPVLHEASSEGAIAGRNAASFPKVRKAKRAVPLSIMFTDPPLAVVGAPRPMRWSWAAHHMPIRVEPGWRPETKGWSGSMPAQTLASSPGPLCSGRGWTTLPTSLRWRSSGGRRRTRCCSFRSTIRPSRKASSPRCARSAKP